MGKKSLALAFLIRSLKERLAQTKKEDIGARLRWYRTSLARIDSIFE